MHGNGKECGAGFCKVQDYIDYIKQGKSELRSAKERQQTVHEFDEAKELTIKILRLDINLEKAKKYIDNNTCDTCPHRKDSMIEAIIDILMERDQQT